MKFLLVLLVTTCVLHATKAYPGIHNDIINGEFLDIRILDLGREFEGHMSQRYLRPLKIAATKLDGMQQSLLIRLSTNYAQISINQTAMTSHFSRHAILIFRKLFKVKDKEEPEEMRQLALVVLRYVEYIARVQAIKVNEPIYKEQSALIKTYVDANSPESIKRYVEFIVERHNFDRQREIYSLNIYNSIVRYLFNMSKENLAKALKETNLGETEDDFRSRISEEMTMEKEELNKWVEWTNSFGLRDVFAAYLYKTKDLLDNLPSSAFENYQNYLSHLAAKYKYKLNARGDIFDASIWIDSATSQYLTKLVAKRERRILPEIPDKDLLDDAEYILGIVRKREKSAIDYHTKSFSIVTDFIMDDLKISKRKSIIKSLLLDISRALNEENFVEINIASRMKTIFTNNIKRVLGILEDYEEDVKFCIPFGERHLITILSPILISYINNRALPLKNHMHDETWQKLNNLSSIQKNEPNWNRMDVLRSTFIHLQKIRDSDLDDEEGRGLQFKIDFLRWRSKYNNIQLSYFVAFDADAMDIWCRSLLGLTEQSMWPEFDTLLYKQFDQSFPRQPDLPQDPPSEASTSSIQGN